MGPAGSGKTTVGELLAAQLAWDFFDADNFHSPANIEKMSRGIPLHDEDRIPWLESIRKAMFQWDSNGRNVVLACSALKRSYRERLQINSNVKLIYLKGSFELFRERLHWSYCRMKVVSSSALSAPCVALKRIAYSPGSSEESGTVATYWMRPSLSGCPSSGEPLPRTCPFLLNSIDKRGGCEELLLR